MGIAFDGIQNLFMRKGLLQMMNGFHEGLFIIEIETFVLFCFGQ